MASVSDDDDLRGMPRVIDALGIGLLLASCGVTLAAMFGGVTVAGMWTGATMATVGLLTRAAAYVVAGWEIKHREVQVPVQRPGRDGRTPATELELVEQLEQDMAERPARFVTMLEEQQERNAAGKGR